MKTTKEATHTPTPWELKGRDIAAKERWIAVIQNHGVNEMNAEDMANAAFIVRAVNSHEALLEELRLLHGTRDGKRLPGQCHYCDTIIQAEAKP